MPRRVDHGERRAHITAALLRIASSRGLQAVTMREVAAEARVSLRLVQYYFTDKRTLMRAGLDELAARFDRRVRERATAHGAGLPPRLALEVVLGSILPTDESSRADRMAWTAYFAATLTDPGLLEGTTDHPDALADLLTGYVVRAQQSGDVDAQRDARIEAASLLALVNGLSDSVLGRQRDAEDALAILGYRLDRLFDGPAVTPGAPG
ncbi:TetR/AcrR family transcriptional regulator [Blastococcus sp. SYSU DS1021]